MGDAIHDNVAQLPAGLQLVAGYVTGSPDIRWTAADWARFPGIPHVTIDQGYTGSPVADADVRDVEPGAWTPANAVQARPWTSARPTIYCSLSTVPQVVAAGWRGDLWVANWTGSRPAAPPVVPGCTVVAVQYASLSTYDLSVVFDPTWPEVAAMTTPSALMQPGWRWCEKCQGLFYQPNTASSHCPAGGQHSAGSSLPFSLPYAR